MHFSADVEINSLLFVPKRNMEKMGMFRNENKVTFSLPKGSHRRGTERFVSNDSFSKGVVDSSACP